MKLLKEQITSRQIQTYLQEFGYLVTLNLAHIQQQAKDEQSKQFLASMQGVLRGKILNGKTFVQLADPQITTPQELTNKIFIHGVLTQIRTYLIYIKEHLQRFVRDGEKKTAWLNILTRLEDGYKQLVTSAGQINENTSSDSSLIYHGTPNNTGNLSLDFVRGGLKSLYGFGVYFYNNLKDVERFIEDEDEKHVYTADISNLNILDIKNELVTKEFLDRLPQEVISEEKYKSITQQLIKMLGKTFEEANDSISFIDEKLLTQFYLKIGVDGLRADKIYCIFNLEKLNYKQFY